MGKITNFTSKEDFVPSVLFSQFSYLCFGLKLNIDIWNTLSSWCESHFKEALTAGPVISTCRLIEQVKQSVHQCSVDKWLGVGAKQLEENISSLKHDSFGPTWLIFMFKPAVADHSDVGCVLTSSSGWCRVPPPLKHRINYTDTNKLKGSIWVNVMSASCLALRVSEL